MGAEHDGQVRLLQVRASGGALPRRSRRSAGSRHHGIEVRDFGPSWRDGVAFQSMVHAIRPDLVDMEEVRRRSNRENLEEAFSLAENQLGIPRLLDPEGHIIVEWFESSVEVLWRVRSDSEGEERLLQDCSPPVLIFKLRLLLSADVDVDKPDEKSIMTYVAQFLKQYPNPGPSGQQEVGPHLLAVKRGVSGSFLRKVLNFSETEFQSGSPSGRPETGSTAEPVLVPCVLDLLFFQSSVHKAAPPALCSRARSSPPLCLSCCSMASLVC